jgi:glycosyltransferase involved in cell wall biosynthesis
MIGKVENRGPSRRRDVRIFHAAGPGDIIGAHKHWRSGVDDPTQVSLTYSGQFEQFCVDAGVEAYLVAYHPDRQTLRDGQFTLEHRPKTWPSAPGIWYHLSELFYALSLWITSVRYGADIVVIDSGTTHYFLMALFRLTSRALIVSLHNTIWPVGFPPRRPVRRIINRLDSLCLRWSAAAVLGVSPACLEQVRQMTGGKGPRLYLYHGRFRRAYFSAMPAPPSYVDTPFRVWFAGRLTADKGALDIADIAEEVERRAPGRVTWTVCGVGPALEPLRKLIRAKGLDRIVDTRGWTSPRDLRDVMAASHAAIVPTRSSFNEGLCMAAVESILAGRPLITSSVVPAIELMRAASLEARTDDIASYADAVLKLASDPAYFARLRTACQGLGEPFLSSDCGLTRKLREATGL